MKILITIGVLFIGLSSFTQAVTLAIISNQKGAPAQMKQAELKSILMGEQQRWRHGSKIIIALMKTNTPVGKYTSEKIYDMSVDELKKYWLALVFQGKADAPIFFNTVTELQAFVAEHPGAIGVIDQPLSTDRTHLVWIDGKKTL